MNPSISGHSPLILRCDVNTSKQSRSFKYFNYMADHKFFLEVMEAQWQGGEGLPLMQKIWVQLKNERGQLKKLHKKEYGNLHEQIDKTRAVVNKVQSMLRNDPSSVTLATQEKEYYIIELNKYLKIKESALRQKSRILWLKHDNDNNFFFQSMKERILKNSVDVCIQIQEKGFLKLLIF